MNLIELSQKKKFRGIPRWWLEGEAERKPPIGKSWRGAGDTLCRHNH
jgi:hypothetical protein